MMKRTKGIYVESIVDFYVKLKVSKLHYTRWIILTNGDVDIKIDRISNLKG